MSVILPDTTSAPLLLVGLMAIGILMSLIEMLVAADGDGEPSQRGWESKYLRCLQVDVLREVVRWKGAMHPCM